MATRTTTVNLVDHFTSPKPGSHGNEDRWGFATNGNGSLSAWVLDGATGFDPSKRFITADVAEISTEAEWYADRLNRYFQSNIRAGSEECDDPRFYRRAIATVRREFERESGLKVSTIPHRAYLPSAAAIFMNYNNKTRTISLKGLGDCSAIVQLEPAETSSTAAPNYAEERAARDRIPFVTKQSYAEESARREKLMREGGYTAEARLALRDMMNTNKGYWILSMHPSAANHMVHETLYIPEGRSAKILLFSDGVERAMKLMNQGPAEMMGLVCDSGLQAVVSHTRKIETQLGAERLKQEFGYSKQHDDATGVLFRLTPGTSPEIG
jgi:hypothetical protein